MPDPYSTDVYPYPPAMWDEAAEHLRSKRGWATQLLMVPANLAEVEATAVAEMSARNVPNTYALVRADPFSQSHLLRISRLMNLNPRWDDVEEHLKDHSTVALLVVDAEADGSVGAIDEARSAMAERGLTVAVGFSSDPVSQMNLLRIERVN